MLTRVVNRYQQLKGFHIEGEYRSSVVTGAFQGSSTGDAAKFVLDSDQNSQKLRLSIDLGKFSSTVISDGETTWTFYPRQHEFTKTDAVADQSDAENMASMIHNAAITQWMTPHPEAGWRLTGEKTLKTSEGKVRCWLLEAKVENGQTLRAWVDKEQTMVLRYEISRTAANGAWDASVSIKRFDTNPPPTSTFVFMPPPGARQVEEVSIPGYAPSLIGQPAREFELKDLDGSPVRLSELRGKVVVLDFWATWCPPCRRELPAIEKLSREFEDKNVVVLGIDDEGVKTIRNYCRSTSLTFATLEDSSGKVHHAYAANAIPNVYIIRPDGIVAHHFVGSREASELRAAILDAASAAPAAQASR